MGFTESELAKSELAKSELAKTGSAGMRRPGALEPSVEQLAQWDREVFWHPFTQMAGYEPLILECGHGCWVTDVAGNRYLDGMSSLWCNIHGHRHPRLDSAIQEQLGKVAHTTALGFSNPTPIKLARRLVDLAQRDLGKSPSGQSLGHVFFSDAGATAVEVALKIAFQYWQQRADPRPKKTSFVALAEAYHGDTLGDVSVGGVQLFHSTFGPLLFPVHRVPQPHPYRRPPDVSREGLLDHCLAAVEQTLVQHHETIAAFVLEPLVQGAAGIVVHPPGYLRGVRELTQKYDVLLIADEVAVGMGRTGTLFACQQEGVVPDLLCLAKGLTGGYLPLAATLTTTEIWNAFLGDYGEAKTFFHGHTYTGNPLGAAVALATLDVFEDEGTLSHLPEKATRLWQWLQKLRQRPHVGDVRQLGLMAGVELVADKSTGEAYPWAQRWGHQVCLQARESKVLVRPLGDVLVIMPPLAISLQEIDTLMGAVEEAIVTVTETTC